MSAGAVPAQAHLSRRLRLAPSAAPNSRLRGLVFYFRFAHKILLPACPLRVCYLPSGNLLPSPVPLASRRESITSLCPASMLRDKLVRVLTNRILHGSISIRHFALRLASGGGWPRGLSPTDQKPRAAARTGRLFQTPASRTPPGADSRTGAASPDNTARQGDGSLRAAKLPAQKLA